MAWPCEQWHDNPRTSQSGSFIGRIRSASWRFQDPGDRLVALHFSSLESQALHVRVLCAIDVSVIFFLNHTHDTESDTEMGSHT